MEVSDNRFRTDIEQLIKALEVPTAERLADTVFAEPAQLPDGGFVGREREMAGLRVAVEEALSGQGRLVMLVGEPGIGKTRTAQEMDRDLIPELPSLVRLERNPSIMTLALFLGATQKEPPPAEVEHPGGGAEEELYHGSTQDISGT